MRIITNEKIDDFASYLVEEEIASSTINKYVHDISEFATWLNGGELGKQDVLKYKQSLLNKYAVSSANSILSSLNRFFLYCEWNELKVKIFKIQRQMFSTKQKELSKCEYEQLLYAAKESHNERLLLVMQTICSTGIRVSELKYITTESLNKGCAQISCKGKQRAVFLPAQLCKKLRQYVAKCKIKSGSIFITKNGKPLDRSNIWADMKKLCKSAGVASEKVFPHNLRHLFARTYYSIQKDIVRLADILGHTSINTTRIYTMESGEIHRQQIQKLGLLRC